MRRHARAASVGLLCTVWGWAGAALASDPPHDSTNLPNGCPDCHIGHFAPGMNQTNVAGNANLCMSCHTANGLVWVAGDQAVLGVSGDSHRWDAPVANPAAGAEAPQQVQVLRRLDGGQLMCSTCHDQHKQLRAPFDPGAPLNPGDAGRHFMRIANDSNALCVDCHRSRDMTDAGRGQWTGSPLSHPVGVKLPLYSTFFSPPRDTTGLDQVSAEVGTSTGGSTTSLVDGAKVWTVNGLSGLVVRFTSGANKGTLRTITSNSGDTISWNGAIVAVGAGITYEIDADGNLSNNIVLDDNGAPSFTQGTVRCMSCHGVHYADSDEATYDDGPGGAGDGNLLRRNNDDRTCNACHDLQVHSSASTSNQYGNWGLTFTCATCHDVHGSSNIYLFRRSITADVDGDGNPDIVGLSVDFENASWLTGVDVNGLVNLIRPGRGPCEVCHTQTQNADGSSRYRNNGSGDGGQHYTGRCTGCHTHKNGFRAGESEGGTNCMGCHGAIWQRINGTTNTDSAGNTIVSRHTIGAVVGTNDSFMYDNPDATWGEPLDGVAPAGRSCTNMCHSDHPHTTSGSPVTHESSVYQDASSAAARGPRDARMSTDFDGTQASGGLCTSCHQSSVTIAGALHPPINVAAYDASQHDYGDGDYTHHDGSVWNRNCTKCHADSTDGYPSDNGMPLGAVHYSRYDSLLRRDPLGNNSTGAFLCYECHGAGDTKDIETPLSRGNSHPVESDTVHDSIAEAAAGAQADQGYNSGLFKGGNRHASCMDCHNPHEAGGTLHAIRTNTIGPDSPLKGVSGLQFTPPAGQWSPTGSGNFTWTSAATHEYEICFKCHTTYTWGAPVPAGEIDVARDFNPNNSRRHQVIESGGGGGGGPPPPDPYNLLWFSEFNTAEPAPNGHLTGDSFQAGNWARRTMQVAEGNNRVSYRVDNNGSGTRYYRARSFVSPDLAAQVLPAANWNLRITARERDRRQNGHLRAYVYIWRSADQIGPVIAGPMTFGDELSTNWSNVSWTFAGAAANVNEGDRLVVEVLFETQNASRNDRLEIRWGDTQGSGDYGWIDPPGDILLVPGAGGGGGVIGSFVNGWAFGDVLTCSDCHNSDQGGDARGPHGSGTVGILKAPYTNQTGSNGTSNHLCFDCHDWNVYSSASDKNDANVTSFAESNFSNNLHGKHWNEGVNGCMECHGTIPHGWPHDYPLFVREDEAPYSDASRLYQQDIPAWGPSGSWNKNDCNRAHMGMGC